MTEVASLQIKIDTLPVVKATAALHGLENQAKKTESAADENSRAFSRLKDSLDPLSGATKQLERDTEILRNELKNGRINFQQYAQSLEQVQARYAQTAAASKSLRGGFRAIRGATQQFGYQIQDIAVQLQSGANAMLVFGQQGSQIASIFGPGGAVIGAILAVAAAVATALVPSLFEAEDKFKDLRDAVAGYLGETKAQELSRVNKLIDEQAAYVGKLKRESREAQEEEIGLFDRLTKSDAELQIQRGNAAAAYQAQLRTTAEAEQELNRLKQRRLELLDDETEEEKRLREQRQSSINSMIAALEIEVATLGKSNAERQVYIATLLGANEEEQKAVRILSEKIEKYEAEQKALQEKARLEKQLKQEEERKASDAFNESQSRLGEIESLRQSLLTREQAEQESYERRKSMLDQALADQYLSQQRHMDLTGALYAQHRERVEQIELEKNNAIAASQSLLLGATSDLFGSMADLTKTFGGEQSTAYKALFAVSKGFAIANAIVQIQTAIANASAAGPFPANLGAMASVASATAGLISTITSTQFAGAYDKGGYIPSGQVGLVGEIGPELVRGPAQVTSRADTAAMMGGGQPNIKIINSVDPSLMLEALGSAAGEKVIMNTVKRNQAALRGR